jgi:hypothetical protein
MVNVAIDHIVVRLLERLQSTNVLDNVANNPTENAPQKGNPRNQNVADTAFRPITTIRPQNSLVKLKYHLANRQATKMF